MKKIFSYIAFFAAIVLLISAYSERVMKAEKGYTAPEIEMLVNDSVEVSLSQLRGKYVLVNFWDSENAVSRIAAGEYDRYFRAHKRPDLRLLSVNTDDNRRLFDEIVRRDGLDSLTQFHIADIKARGISPGYHPEGGYSSYLLNPSGKIVAVNPTVQAINRIINTHGK